jgi:hypothetical protein
VFVLFVVSQSVGFWQLHRLKETGRSSRATAIPYIIFSSVHRIALLVTIPLLAYGWYIVRIDFPSVQIIPGALVVFAYAGLLTVSEYLVAGWGQVVVALVGVPVLAVDSGASREVLFLAYCGTYSCDSGGQNCTKNNAGLRELFDDAPVRTVVGRITNQPRREMLNVLHDSRAGQAIGAIPNQSPTKAHSR